MEGHDPEKLRTSVEARLCFFFFFTCSVLNHVVVFYSLYNLEKKTKTSQNKTTLHG